MVNYQNGKIYKLVNNVDDEIYVGSTTTSLSRRKGGHVDKAKYYPNRKLYKHLLDELEGEDVYVDTDSVPLHESLKESSVTCYMRDRRFIDLETDSDYKVSPVLLMIDNFLDKYVENYFVNNLC